MSFQAANLPAEITDVLSKNDIQDPTPIQAISFDEIASNHDVYLQAQTGSGKTLAYLLPLLAKLKTDTTALQVLILAPTHELSSQIHDVVKLFSTCFNPDLKSMLILGDTSSKRQIDRLKKKPHIVVGSAGRINDLISQKKLKMHQLNTLVLDEADRMLIDANMNTIDNIISAAPEDRQLIFVSATQTSETSSLVKEFAPEIKFLIPEEAQINENITHAFLETSKHDKLDSLRMLLKACKPTKSIIFVHHQDTVPFILSAIKDKGKVVGLTSHDQKQDRQKTIQDFKSGKIKTLITTDLSARGLDIPEITHVFNYDLPTYSENYLHRAGRTGRIGKAGGCVSLVEGRELRSLDKIEKKLNITIEDLA